MPLPIPNIDDRRFEDLVQTLKDQIPRLTEELTDLNPSDPTVTITELWCWLAEMILYRMNMIQIKSFTNFYKLILDLPEPVTVEITLSIEPTISSTSINIPPGQTIATYIQDPPHPLSINGRWIFETFQEHVFEPDDDDNLPPITFPMRSKVVIENEELGISKGQPDQVFYLKQGPILIDEEKTSTEYNPNPKIKIDGEIWEFVPDFLDDSTDENTQKFMVNQLTNSIRFGNGVKGKIPPADKTIVVEQYQIILGREIKIDHNMVDPTQFEYEIPGFQIMDINNKPAEGGNFIFSSSEFQTTGLSLFKEKFRAITAEDFSELATVQFNRAQESDFIPASSSNRVSRAIAVPGKNFTDINNPDEPAAISVIILPKPSEGNETKLIPDQDLLEKVERFLDKRRLITTRIYVVAPDYKDINLKIQIVAEPRADIAYIQDEIKIQVEKYFHPLTGGDQENGWPIGRNVYKAEIFQIIESVAGVDYVKYIEMNGDRIQNKIDLSENQLPHIGDITITF